MNVLHTARVSKLAARNFAENGNLKPLMLFSDCCGGKLQAIAVQNVVCKLPFLSGSNKLTFGLEHVLWFNFVFSLKISNSFIFIFLCLRFISII